MAILRVVVTSTDCLLFKCCHLAHILMRFICAVCSEAHQGSNTTSTNRCILSCDCVGVSTMFFRLKVREPMSKAVLG